MSRLTSATTAKPRRFGGPKRRVRPRPKRTCHFCGLPIPDDESAIEARTKNAWAHVTCWYDGSPFERDHKTGRQL